MPRLSSISHYNGSVCANTLGVHWTNSALIKKQFSRRDTCSLAPLLNNLQISRDNTEFLELQEEEWTLFIKEGTRETSAGLGFCKCIPVIFFKKQKHVRKAQRSSYLILKACLVLVVVS